MLWPVPFRIINKLRYGLPALLAALGAAPSTPPSFPSRPGSFVGTTFSLWTATGVYGQAQARENIRLRKRNRFAAHLNVRRHLALIRYEYNFSSTDWCGTRTVGDSFDSSCHLLCGLLDLDDC
jgi:hypothetical protein